MTDATSGDVRCGSVVLMRGFKHTIPNDIVDDTYTASALEDRYDVFVYIGHATRAAAIDAIKAPVFDYEAFVASLSSSPLAPTQEGA